MSVIQGKTSAPVKAAPGRGAGRLLRAFLAGVLALLILRWALPGLFPAVTRALFGGGHGWLSAVVLGMALLFLFGLIILVHWPFSSLIVLGIILGVDLIQAGIGWINLGLFLKKTA